MRYIPRIRLLFCSFVVLSCLALSVSSASPLQLASPPPSEAAEKIKIEAEIARLEALRASMDAEDKKSGLQELTRALIHSQQKELSDQIAALSKIRDNLQAIVEISALMPKLSGNTATVAVSKLAELRAQLANLKRAPELLASTETSAVTLSPSASLPLSSAPAPVGASAPATTAPAEVASQPAAVSPGNGSRGASGVASVPIAIPPTVSAVTGGNVVPAVAPARVTAAQPSASSTDPLPNTHPCPPADGRPTLNPARPWDYTVSGFFDMTSYTGVQVIVDGRTVGVAKPGSGKDADVAFNPLLDSKTCAFTVWLKQPLTDHETVRIRPTVAGGASGPWSDEIIVGRAIVPAKKDSSQNDATQKDSQNKDVHLVHSTCPVLLSDCRDPLEASVYLGLGIDTFASGETLQYLNPDASNGAKERMVAGFDFAYRIVGHPQVNYRNSWFIPNQLWIYGETVHGVRSSDIDCTQHPNFLTCQDALTTAHAPEQVLFVIRNASTLEGFGGLRYEFLSLQPRFVESANLYVKAQVGFLTASGRPGSAVAIHHVGLGALATKGKFQDSYLEVGYGRNDLFVQKRKERWKVDALLSRDIGKGVSFFTQITVDTDLGHGSDSIQTYIGFSFDLGRLKFFGASPDTTTSNSAVAATTNSGSN